MTKKQPLILLFAIMILSTTAIAVTVTGGSSSYSFNVENCTANPTTELTCGSATIFYTCDIGDPMFIDTVDFRIDGNDYTTTQNSTKPYQFYLFYNKPNETSTTYDPLIFDRQRITDVDNKKVNAFETVSINRTCETCEVTFTSNPIDFCTTNNTQLYQYTSNNETCQPSYNTTETCDYCEPYLIANTTTCLQNNTKITTYQDLNYNTCCQETLLASDCPTQSYPYNQQTSQTCEYYQSDFLCNIDEAPIIDDKINLNCELPETEACCVINIYQNQNGSRTLLQTSPEYSSPTQGNLINIFQKETETRTCFQTQNRLLNAYYTDKELRPETEYELEVICTSQNQSYKTIKEINPVYKIPDQAIHRIIFLGNNPVLIITWVIIAIIGLLILAFVFNKIRGR